MKVFSEQVACETGVDGAIMLENFKFWIDKNIANEKHFYDGNYWTYNSLDAFTKLFPFWSKRQIERIIKNLEKDGFLIKGNYNKMAFDRTSWYALTEKAWKLVSPNSYNDITDWGNLMSPNGEISCHETVSPIPDIYTDIKTNIYNIYSSVIEYLNEKANTKYKRTSKKTVSLIDARIKEGFTEEDFKRVIDIKTKEWLNTDMEKFLRPETLFGTKFEGYLNQREVKKYGEFRKDKSNNNEFERFKPKESKFKGVPGEGYKEPGNWGDELY